MFRSLTEGKAQTQLTKIQQLISADGWSGKSVITRYMLINITSLFLISYHHIISSHFSFSLLMYVDIIVSRLPSPKAWIKMYSSASEINSYIIQIVSCAGSGNSQSTYFAKMTAPPPIQWYSKRHYPHAQRPVKECATNSISMCLVTAKLRTKDKKTRS